MFSCDYCKLSFRLKHDYKKHQCKKDNGDRAEEIITSSTSEDNVRIGTAEGVGPEQPEPVVNSVLAEDVVTDVREKNLDHLLHLVLSKKVLTPNLFFIAKSTARSMPMHRDHILHDF